MEIKEKINNIKTKQELELYRNEINEAFVQREKFIDLCTFASKASENDFGFIKEAFETLSPVLFESEEGKNIINKYIKTVNKSSNLKSLHTIFENIRKADKNVDVDFFVNNIINTKRSDNTNNISEDVKMVGRILSEAILCVGNDAENLMSEISKSTSLNNAILYIVENKKNDNNIVEYGNAIKIIKENINSKESVNNIFEFNDFDTHIKSLVESFNSKYKGLSDEEKSVIKELSKSNDKEDLFNKYKDECITNLKEAKEKYKETDKVTYNRLADILEKVENKNYINENISTDICGFINLSNLFK
jgi:hypothetical protein